MKNLQRKVKSKKNENPRKKNKKLKKKMKNPRLESTPHTYLMHCPQCMQDKICMK